LPKESRGWAFRLSLVGSVLIFLNAIWIYSNDKPIVLTNNANLTTVGAINNSTAFWGRISFGYGGMVGGLWTPFWLIFSIALFACTLQIYRKPRAHRILGIPMMIFSLLSLPVGGGFLIGSILAFIGGMMAIEWPTPFSETFVGKMIRTIRLDSKVAGGLLNDANSLRSGILALLFTGITMGFGNAVYVFNLNLIKTKPADAYNILLQGKLGMDIMTAANAISFIGITFLRWIAFSVILYVVMVKLKGHEADYEKIASVVAFAFIPLSIQAFLPVLFSNEPYLSFNWPFALLALSTLWVALAVFVFARQMFELKAREALGVTLLAGALYLLLESLFVLVVLSVPSVSLPGVIIQFQALSVNTMLFFFSLAVALAFLLGGLSRKRL
jgi:hypothetical protein